MEVTTSLAVAKEGSTDAVVAIFLSGLGGVFSFKAQQRTALKTFLIIKGFFLFTPDCLWQEFCCTVAHSGLPCDSDAHLMSALAPIGSFEVLLRW